VEEPLGQELLLDNDIVRVWLDVVAPGDAQPVHTHRSPYLSITLTRTRAQVLEPDGSLRYDVDRGAGEATWFGADRIPTTHTMRNVGDEEVRVLIVEVRSHRLGNAPP
jgi:hypothetical protein